MANCYLKLNGQGSAQSRHIQNQSLDGIRHDVDAEPPITPGTSRGVAPVIMDANGWLLRDVYRTLETPGNNKLLAAYGMKEKEDILAFLLTLNLALIA